MRGRARVERVLGAPLHRYAEHRLAQRKRSQLAAFEVHGRQFEAIYQAASRGTGGEALLTPVWERFNKQLEQVLLPQPTPDFLRDPVLSMTMFVDARGEWMRTQRRVVEGTFGEGAVRDYVEEDAPGSPPIAHLRWVTSHNSIHHAYHLARFAAASGIGLARIQQVVEWGGGYGNQAKIFRRINPQATYTIIDTPLFIALQWLYLAATTGEQSVHLIQGGEEARQGVVNLVPITSLEHHQHQCDLFVSTWALSESSTAAQDLVVSNQWFGAQHLLLAFQEGYEQEELRLEDPSRVGELAETSGAQVEEVGSFLPRNHYAFK